MAYNPSMYMPYGQQGYPQQAQPSWPYQPQAAQPVNGLVSVTGIEGAKAYQLPPNSQMPLFDADEDVLYVKTTDAAGYPTIRAFSFAPVERQEQAPQGAYVTREDFDALAAKVDALAAKPARAVRKAAGDGE